MPELRLPVEAQGCLRLDAPSGRTLELVADGATLRLDVPAWTDLTGLSPKSWSGRIAALRRLSTLLSAGALTLHMHSKGRTLLELGADASPNWVARLAGLSNARIPIAAASLLFRR